jgi:heme exporter protein D
MYFASFSDLLSMDGHGAYVWSAYAIVAVVLLIMVRSPLARHRRTIERIRRRRGVERAAVRREEEGHASGA